VRVVHDFGPGGAKCLGLLARHHAPHGAHELINLILGRFRPLALSHQAMASVVVEQAESDLVESRLYGGYLRQNVDAVAVFLDHAGDAPNLSLDSRQSRHELTLGS
jgi:hypothetical protein